MSSFWMDGTWPFRNLRFLKHVRVPCFRFPQTNRFWKDPIPGPGLGQAWAGHGPRLGRKNLTPARDLGISLIKVSHSVWHILMWFLKAWKAVCSPPSTSVKVFQNYLQHNGQPYRLFETKASKAPQERSLKVSLPYCLLMQASAF